jgi:uncharacterized membrane protein (DUF485 family)
MANDARGVGSAGPATPDPSAADAAGATQTAGVAQEGGEVAELAARHRRFTWPMTAFFLIYYMLLMWLPSVAPGFMGRKVVGNFTFAYLFALSQFVMTFIVAWLYSRFARRRLDPLAAEYRRRVTGSSSEVTE